MIPSLERQRQEDTRDWLVSLADKLQVSEKPYLKKPRWEHLQNDTGSALWFLHVCTHMYILIQRNIHTGKRNVDVG